MLPTATIHRQRFTIVSVPMYRCFLPPHAKNACDYNAHVAVFALGVRSLGPSAVVFGLIRYIAGGVQ